MREPGTSPVTGSRCLKQETFMAAATGLINEDHNRFCVSPATNQQKGSVEGAVLKDMESLDRATEDFLRSEFLPY